MSAHRHTWGTQGRAPRPGDLCLTCPTEWTKRGRSEQYEAADYKPRTEAHRIHPAPVVAMKENRAT